MAYEKITKMDDFKFANKLVVSRDRLMNGIMLNPNTNNTKNIGHFLRFSKTDVGLTYAVLNISK